jgi:hypothetical protein
MSVETTIPETASEYDALLDEDVRDEAQLPPVAPVQADTVNITGNAGDVQARLVNVDHGGIAQVRAEALTVTVKNSGIGAAAAGTFDATLENSGIGALAARKAEIKGGSIAVLAAAQVELKDNARVMFDLRAGALAGVVAGSLFGIIYGVMRLLLGRGKR